MVNIVVVNAAVGVVCNILQVAPLAKVPLVGHTLATAGAVVIVTGPIASARIERWRCTIDNTLAADHLLLVEVGGETVRCLHTEGAKIVLIVLWRGREWKKYFEIDTTERNRKERKPPTVASFKMTSGLLFADSAYNGWLTGLTVNWLAIHICRKSLLMGKLNLRCEWKQEMERCAATHDSC